ncbi:hypothetical protein F5Y08DRAFT_346058 [Xylaria arbuscula]|nr:hypothetical protein F5Y08DRAFT_346058 [Xylaria arbuscula]
MSQKQTKQSKPHHHPHRRSHHSRPAVSPHSRRGRSRSRPERRARSSSVRVQSRAAPQPRVRSHSRSLPRRAVNTRDIPFYIPPSGQNGGSIPTIIVEALRKQDEEHNSALTATNLGHRLPTPPPEPNLLGHEMAPAPAAPGLKRRPSSSPAAANARRRRRRRPRPRQRSVISDPEENIPPPRPQPAPFYPPRPASPSFSFLGIKRTKAEKERRELEAKKKRDKKEDRKLRKDGQRGNYEKLESPKRPKAPKAKKLAKSPPVRATSAPPPPLNHVPVPEEQYYNQLYEQQPPWTSSGSQRGHQSRHKGSKQRHKKHHRRLAEQHHRRQKRRNKFTMRDFFKSLRRKLGSLFRFTTPTPSPPPAPPAAAATQQSVPAYAEAGYYYASPTRDSPYGVDAQYEKSESQIFNGQATRRGRRRVDSARHTQPLPYFMHGGRSPAASWHSRLSSRPGSTRRFTATVESAAPSPVIQEPVDELPRVSPGLSGGSSGGGGGLHAPQRYSHQSSASAISVIARRFMGPFFSESTDPSVLGGNEGLGSGGGSQKRLSWRSHKLLTAGSRPATPPSSRAPSPAGIAPSRGRSKERESLGSMQRESIPETGAYTYTVRSLSIPPQDPYLSAGDRRSRSASPYRVVVLEARIADPVTASTSPISSSPLASPPLSPDYGLADLFATPLPEEVGGSPANGGTPLRVASPDYGLQRLFSPSPASTGSNFGLRRLFGD